MCSSIKLSLGGMDDPDECRRTLESLSGRVLQPIWYVCDTGLFPAKVLHTGVMELLELNYYLGQFYQRSFLPLASKPKKVEGKSHVERIQHIGKVLNSHPFRIIEPGDRAHAAVALILEETPNGLNVLFIERSINANDLWSGQIAFPGGRVENHDNSPRHTAERETREELGVNLSEARYLGRLSDVVPGGLRIVVSCFVYAVDQHPILHPDHREVAAAFWLPLREINNPARRSQVEFMFRERLRKFPAARIRHGKEKPLWGLTYRVLRNLNRVIKYDRSE